MPLDVDDLERFDFVETVEIHHRTPTGTVTIYTGVIALKRAVTAPTTGGSVEMGIDRAVWHIKASTCPVRVLRNDKIKDASGNYWLVKSEAVLSFGTRYRVETVKLEEDS